MRLASILILLLLLSACASSPSSKVTNFSFGDTNVLATTGNLRLVTERTRTLPDGRPMSIVCTEPSPDYAIAFGQAASADLKASINNRGSGEGSANYAATEAATQLAGRTAGVLALRDGLYAACQSYANGVIGHDAYAMILSQYGDLLVSLVGGSAGSGGGGGAATAAAAGGTTVNVQTAASAPAKTSAAKDVSGSSSSSLADETKRSTMAALLVACISEQDPTRGDPNMRKSALLDPAFCKRVTTQALTLATGTAVAPHAKPGHA